MKRKDNKIKVFLVVALILFITVGYAALTTTLNITGNSEIKSVKWYIHFANLVVDDISVDATTPATIDSNKTTVNYVVNLVKPGDIYSFTVDVVNEGTIDGMISTVTNTGLTAEQQKYVEYSITYVNGAELKEKDGLKAGATRSVKVQVKYKDDLNPEDLPQEDKTLNLAFTIKYVQADDTVIFPSMMRAYIMNSTYDYHNDTYRNKVTKIVTKTNIDVPETAIKQWDVSAVGNGSVIAYIEDDGSGNGTYKVTIGGDQCKVIANEDSSALFSDFTNLKEIDLSNLDTRKVTNMHSMFNGCSKLTSLDVSSFDTSKVTDMTAIFQRCSKLTSLDLSEFNTSNVTKMTQMFLECMNLTNLDLSNFDTSNVTSMYNMFHKCSNLTSLNVSSFDTSKVVNMSGMFYKCSSLTSLDLSHFDTSKVADIRYMFRECNKLTTFITIRNSKMSSSSLYTDMFYNAATEIGSQITVNYISATSDLVDQMIATKSDTSNVIKGVLVS